MANRRYSSLFGGVKASGAAQSEAMISKQTAPVVARYVRRFGFDSILIIVKCSTALFAAQPSGVNRALAKQFGQPSLEPMKSIGTMNRDWLVAQAFEPAGSGDFRVARFSSTGLESPVNRQAGKPAPHSGSWKAATTFMPCMEIMNLRRVGRCHQQGAADVSSAEVLSEFLRRQDAGSTLGFMERNDSLSGTSAREPGLLDWIDTPKLANVDLCTAPFRHPIRPRQHRQNKPRKTLEIRAPLLRRRHRLLKRSPSLLQLPALNPQPIALNPR